MKNSITHSITFILALTSLGYSEHYGDYIEGSIEQTDVYSMPSDFVNGWSYVGYHEGSFNGTDISQYYFNIPSSSASESRRSGAVYFDDNTGLMTDAVYYRPVQAGVYRCTTGFYDSQTSTYYLQLIAWYGPDTLDPDLVMTKNNKQYVKAEVAPDSCTSFEKGYATYATMNNNGICNGTNNYVSFPCSTYTTSRVQLNDPSSTYDIELIPELVGMYKADSIFAVQKRAYTYGTYFMFYVTSILSNSSLICSIKVADNQLQNYTYDIKANSEGLFFTTGGKLYRITTSGYSTIVSSNVVGFNVNNGAVWYTTGSALYSCNYDGSSNTLIKSGSTYNSEAFIVHPKDSTFFYRGSSAINSQYCILADNDIVLDIPEGTFVSDSVYNFRIDANDNIWVDQLHGNWDNYPIKDTTYFTIRIDHENKMVMYYSHNDGPFHILPDGETAYVGGGDKFYKYNLNHIPTFTTSSTTMDSAGSYNGSINYRATLNVVDHNSSDNITFTQLSSHNWLSLVTSGNTCNVLASNQPVSEGTYTIAIKAEDSNSSDTLEWTTVVYSRNLTATSSNFPTTASEGVQYTGSISLEDKDDETISISQSTIPSWLTLTQSGSQSYTLTGTPSSTDDDTQINIVFTDNTTNVDPVTGNQYAPTTVTVNYNLTVNNIPVITTTPSDTMYLDNNLPLNNNDYTYTMITTDESGDNLVYSFVQNPTGMLLRGIPGFSNVNYKYGLVSAGRSYGLTQEGSYPVEIRVADEQGLYVTQTYTLVVVDTTHYAPVITTTSLITSVNEDATYSQSFSATDGNGDNITWSIVTAPSWISLTDSTISGSTTQNEVGDHTIKVMASDGEKSDTISYTLTVVNINDAPAITSTSSTSVNEDATFTYTITATDDDNDNLTYSLTSSPDGMSISGNTVSWNPVQANVGNHSVGIKVVDGNNGEDTQAFTLTVNNVNDAPAITTNPDTTANERSPYTYDVNASDEDGDNLTYSLETAPSGMTIDTDGIISWTPSTVGRENVTVKVVDGNNGEDIQSYSLVVYNINDNPVFTSRPDTDILEGEEFVYGLTATDADGDNLTYTLVSSPSGMVLTNDTIRYTPEHPGDSTVTVTVSDGNGGEDTQNFTLYITNTNDKPVITTTKFLTIATQDSFYQQDFEVVDEDGDSIEWTMIEGPSWLNTGSPKVIGTPAQENVGKVETIKVVASDGMASDTIEYQLTVNNVNDAPAITSTPASTSLNEDAPYTYEVIASDPDNDNLTYSATGHSGLSMVSNILSWIPVQEDVGTHRITITVTDGSSTVNQEFDLTVNNVNDIPQMNTVLVDSTITELDSILLTMDATDVDNTPVVKWFKGEQELGTGSSYKFKTDYNSAGTHVIKVGVSDNDTTIYQEVTITVNNLNRAPVFNFNDTTFTGYASEDTIRFTATATDPDGDNLIYGFFGITSEMLAKHNFIRQDSVVAIALKDRTTDTLQFGISDGEIFVTRKIIIDSKGRETRVINGRNAPITNYLKIGNTRGNIKVMFGVAQENTVRFSIYNLEGRLIQTLVNGKKASAHYSENLRMISTGTYVYRFSIGKEFVRTSALRIVR